MFASFLIVSLLFSSVRELRGQSTTPRAQFVFHVYVDPLFGDDVQAMLNNPGGTATPTPTVPLSLHPHMDVDMASPTFGKHTITGHLQHAPYSFRTLSGSSGALSYVRTRIPPLPSGPPEPQLTHVVIHCLPGLYGPRLQAPIDPVSGLPFNGEQFPIELDMERVSLQGTSVLDTVFDARGQSTAILRVTTTTVFAGHEQHQFLDGIAFRNARAGQGAALGAGAAVWLRGVPFQTNSYAAATTITNCTFQGNDVGLAIDVNARFQPGVLFDYARHRAIVFNNTFRWNTIGVWQGDLGGQFAPPGLIMTDVHSVFANNLFDISPPPEGSGLPVPLSAFEGIQPMQRSVTLRGAVAVPSLDFNAFADGRQDPNVAPTTFNIQATVGAFPVALPLALPEPLPRVDLLAFTPVQPGQLRTLFVADALRNAPGAVPSDHDLRLSPNAGMAGPTGIPNPVAVHPCANMGIDADWPPALDIRFQNNTRLCSGQLGLASYTMPVSPVCGPMSTDVEEAPLSGWDCDGEGFGNRRVAPLSYLPKPDENYYGIIDIGADELDELIVAGFVNGTRMFTGAVIPNAAGGLDDHTRVYFFGRVGTSRPRPMANTQLGVMFPWYEHVQDGPGMTPMDRVVGNFTDGAMFVGSSNTVRHFQLGWSPPANAYSGRHEFPRNLECDFSGTLAADPHPLWGVLFGLVPLYGLTWSFDGYATNPWFGTWNHDSQLYVHLWNDPVATPSDVLTDNQALYHNKGVADLHRTWWSSNSPPYLPAESYVLAGHLSPPMTVPAPSVGGSWLLQWNGPAPFGPFGTCSGSTLSFGSWCFNDSPIGCPDTIPEFPGEAGLGRRFNLEPQAGQSDPRNMQTYLQVFPSDLPPALRSAGGATDLELARRAVRDMVERFERRGERR